MFILNNKTYLTRQISYTWVNGITACTLTKILIKSKFEHTFKLIRVYDRGFDRDNMSTSLSILTPSYHQL